MLRSAERSRRSADLSHATPRCTGAPRPMTPDGLPIIGPMSRRGDAIVATGHGMLGVTLAAITGELGAEAIFERSDRAVALCAPGRSY